MPQKSMYILTNALVWFDRIRGFLATFGDSLKRHIICSSYPPRRREQGPPARDNLLRVHDIGPNGTARVGRDILRDTTPPARSASGDTRGYAATAGVCDDGSRGRAARAGPSRGASTKRRLRRSRRARPNIWRLSILRRLIWPSTGPLDQGSVTPALTAS